MLARAGLEAVRLVRLLLIEWVVVAAVQMRLAGWVVEVVLS